MSSRPNVAGMLADSDFQGLSPADKRLALGKLTGDSAFASLSDAETMQFVSKFPMPKQQLQIPDATAQAQAMFPKPGMGLPPGGKELPPAGEEFVGPQSYTSMSPTGVLTSPRIPAKTQAGMIGAGLGGIGMAGLPGGASLPATIRALGIASGAGAGAGAGNLAGGGSPSESLSTAATTTAAGMALAPVSPFLKWLTSSKSAGAALLQQASAKAGSAPVELSAETNKIIDDIVNQGKSGQTIPKVITDLLDRLGPSTRQAADAIPGPLTYDEARLFQSNASRLSTLESMTLKGRMQSLMPKFARSFGQDVQAAADQAGAGAEHAAGMREYATAIARDEVLKKVAEAGIKHVGKAALTGAGAGAGYGIYRTLTGR